MTALEYCQAQLDTLCLRRDEFCARLKNVTTDQEQAELRRKIRIYTAAITSVLDQQEFLTRSSGVMAQPHREYTISWREE